MRLRLLRAAPDRPDARLVIDKLCVSRWWRRRGYGRALLQAALDHAARDAECAACRPAIRAVIPGHIRVMKVFAAAGLAPRAHTALPDNTVVREVYHTSLGWEDCVCGALSRSAGGGERGGGGGGGASGERMDEDE